MSLLNKRLLKRFLEVGSQQHVPDPIVITIFYNPTGTEIWYATEYDPKTKLFFGYFGKMNETTSKWDYFSLEKLESYVGRFGAGIERQKYCREFRIQNVLTAKENYYGE